MSFDYIRKLVSGNKARFIDPEAAVNLDLVYGKFSQVVSLSYTAEPEFEVTDRIIMFVHA